MKPGDQAELFDEDGNVIETDAPVTYDFGEGDGWIGVTGVAGWKNFEVEVKVELFAGRPRIVGLKVDPMGDPRLEHIIDSRKIGTLPVGYLAGQAAVHRSSGGGVIWAERSDVIPERPRGGSVEFSEAVAETYRQARAAGQSGQNAVSQRWRTSRKTAERWIAEARRREALEPATPRNARGRG